MSALNWNVDVTRARELLTRRPQLTVVPRPLVRMARLPFILVLAAVLGAGMVLLLLLNTTLQTRAFEVRDLQRQATTLGYAQAELESKVAAEEAPAVLAKRASALGMRPNPYPAFIEVPSGKVLGTSHRVTGSEMSSMTVRSGGGSADAKRKAAADKAAKAQRAAAERAAAEKKAAEQKAAEKKAAEQKAAEKKTAEQKAAEQKKSTTGER